MSVNPYQPAVPPVVFPASETSIQVDGFGVNPAAFKCGCFNPQSFSEALKSEIQKCCQQRGLQITDSPGAGVHVSGNVHAVDEGNQALRYLFPFLAGASLVHVEGTIRFRSGEVQPFTKVLRTYMGAFGGRSDKIIQLAIKRISLFIAGEAAVKVLPAARQDNQFVALYYWSCAAVSLLSTIGMGMLAYSWASKLPAGNSSVKPHEVPFLVGVLCLSMLTTVLLASTALAPSRVLKSRSMMWLTAISGTQSMFLLRVIILFLASVAGLVVFICCKLASGS